MSKVTLKLTETNFDPDNPYKVLQGAVFDNMATHDSISQLTSALAGKDKNNKPLQDAADNLKRSSGNLASTAKDSSTNSSRLEGAFSAIDRMGNMAVNLYDQDINVKRDINNIVGLFGDAGKMIFGESEKGSGMFSQITSQLGDWVGKFFNGSLDRMFEYQAVLKQVSDAGMAFEGDLLSIKRAAGEARMQIGDFARVMQQNATNFAGFGTSASRGAEVFGKLTEELYEGADPSINALKRLGYNSEQVSKFMAQQLRLGRRRDIEQEDVRQREAQSVVRLAREMDLMARLTGKSREEQEKELAKVQTDVDFQAYASLNDRDGSKEMIQRVSEASVMLQNYGPDVQQLFKEMVTRGQAVNQNTILAQQNLGAEAMAQIREMARRVQEGVGPEEMQKLIDRSGAAIQARVQSPQFLEMISLAQVGSELGDNARKMYTDAAIAMRDHVNSVLRDNTKNITTVQEAYLTSLLAQARNDQERQIKGTEAETGALISTLIDTVETSGQNLGSAISTNLLDKVEEVGSHVGTFGVSVNHLITKVNQLGTKGLDKLTQMINPTGVDEETGKNVYIEHDTDEVNNSITSTLKETLPLNLDSSITSEPLIKQVIANKLKSDEEHAQEITDSSHNQAMLQVDNYINGWHQKDKETAAEWRDYIQEATAMRDHVEMTQQKAQIETMAMMERVQGKKAQDELSHERAMAAERSDALRDQHRQNEAHVQQMSTLQQQEQANIKTEQEQEQEKINAILGPVTSSIGSLSNNLLTIPEPITTELKTQTDSLIGAFAQGANDTIAAIQTQQPVKIIETRVEAPSPNSVQSKQNQSEIQTYLQPSQQKVDDALADLEGELNSTTADVIVEKLDKVEKVIEKSNTILDYMAGQSLTQTGMMAGNMSAKDRQSYVHAAL